jgi:hypothetical protein
MRTEEISNFWTKFSQMAVSASVMKIDANLIVKFILCYILMECFFDRCFANMPFDMKL